MIPTARLLNYSATGGVARYAFDVPMNIIHDQDDFLSQSDKLMINDRRIIEKGKINFDETLQGFLPSITP